MTSVPRLAELHGGVVSSPSFWWFHVVLAQLAWESVPVSWTCCIGFFVGGRTNLENFILFLKRGFWRFWGRLRLLLFTVVFEETSASRTTMEPQQTTHFFSKLCTGSCSCLICGVFLWLMLKLPRLNTRSSFQV